MDARSGRARPRPARGAFITQAGASGPRARCEGGDQQRRAAIDAGSRSARRAGEWSARSDRRGVGTRLHARGRRTVGNRSERGAGARTITAHRNTWRCHQRIGRCRAQLCAFARARHGTAGRFSSYTRHSRALAGGCDTEGRTLGRHRAGHRAHQRAHGNPGAR